MNRIEISFAEPMSITSDATTQSLELLEGRFKGNQPNIGTLIDRYHSRLLHLARMFVQNKAEAEEVVREMGEKILEDITKDEDQSYLEILIFQVLTKRNQICEVQEIWEKSSHVHLSKI